LRAAELVGVARGLTTLIQLLAATSSANAGQVSLPGARILDAPRYPWRGLSLDVARTFVTVDDVRRVIDPLALYKLNVLHLHLTDDDGWRLPVGRLAESSKSDTFYSAEDLRGLAACAEDRFVTIVPEVDTPGHASAFVQMRPELNSGRYLVEIELAPDHKRRAVWLDPELPATFEVAKEVLAGVAAIFRGPYIHIGEDEPRGMPHDLYSSYVQRIRGLVRSIGKRPLGRVSACRPWPGRCHPVLAYRDRPLAVVAAGVSSAIGGDLALSRRDVEMALAASVPVIVSPLSHCYLDIPLRRTVRRSRAGGKAGPGRPAGLFTQDRRRVVRLGPHRSAWARSSSARRGNRSRGLGGDDLRLRRSMFPTVASVGQRRPQGLEQPAGRHLDRPPRSPRSARPTVGARRPHVRTSTVDWL